MSKWKNVIADVTWYNESRSILQCLLQLRIGMHWHRLWMMTLVMMIIVTVTKALCVW